MSSDDWRLSFEVGCDEHGRYYAQLPHQCQSWVIVGDEDAMYPSYEGESGDHVTSKDEALAQFDRWLAAAHEARDRLAAL